MNPSPTVAALPFRVSVVVCTYNGSAYIEDQIASIQGQSRLPDEVVIADDASTDTTPAMVQALAERLRGQGIEVRTVLRPVNLGFIANFSEALTLATGDLIFLCDQDDRWMPRKIQIMVDLFAADPGLALAFSDARLVDARGNDMGHRLFDALELDMCDWQRLREGNGFEVLLRRAVVTGATAAFRCSLRDGALPVATGWIHDEWLATVASMTGRIAFIDEPLIDYRQHGNNQIGMRPRTWRDRTTDLFRPRRALLEVAIERMASLRRRFGNDTSVPERWRRLLAEREMHYRERLRIGALSRVQRWMPILREWRRAGYTTHGNGRSSVLRDLLRND